MLFHDEVLQSEFNQPKKMPVWVVFEKGVSRRCFNICKRKIAEYFFIETLGQFPAMFVVRESSILS